ncbi:unnamed protein product [Adineta steineri]|uniref:Uncharacterized protein n=1 Tax=Adineta steineri TaxID=433720 RepID=A0A814T2U8_9BILA|nr:unnamed protein product [Adineta steineri]CAF3503064.1 unnamed protein product [Adineta steineri]
MSIIFCLRILILFILNIYCNCEYIYPGLVWNDTDGKSIQAHATGILIDPNDESYWWYGESLKTSTLSDHGINCYHSKDLINWTNMGEVLGQKQVFIKDLSGPYVIERPKVIWNEKTKLYVMWFHLDSIDYKYRYVGVATSLIPNGIFKFVNAFQPDGIPSLDMNIYEDKINNIVRGVYLVRSCNNEYVGISQLTDDYLNTTGIISTIGEPREGHAIFYRNNHYYMMTSHLTGWSPNPAELFITNQDNLHNAKWYSLGNPTNSSTTFNSQSTFVLPFPSTKYPGTYFYIYMGDRWNYPNLLNATYIWLPFTFNSDTNVTLQWKDQWSLTDY